MLLRSDLNSDALAYPKTFREADMPCVHHYCKDALLGQVAWSPYFNFTLNSTNLPADFNINMTFSVSVAALLRGAGASDRTTCIPSPPVVCPS